MNSTNGNAPVPRDHASDDVVAALAEVEAALFQSEVLYQTFLEQSPIGLAHLDAAGVVTFENHRLRAITGEDPEAAWIGRSLEEIDGLDPRLPNLAAQMLVDGEALGETEIDLVRSDGARRVLRVHGAPILHSQSSMDESGAVGGVLMVSDVTAEHERAEKLRVLRHYEEAEPFLHHAAISLPSSHDFLRDAARILGETAEADCAVVLFLDEPSGTYTEQTRWQCDADAAPSPLCLDAVLMPELVDARTMPAGASAPEMVALPLDAESSAAGLVLLTRDAGGPERWAETERHALGRLGALVETLWAWLRAEARYRQVVASIEDTLFSFALGPNGERTYTFLSAQAEALTGYATADLLTGTPAWRDLVQPDDRAAVDEHDRALRDRRDSRLVYRIRTADGTIRWLRESASPHRDRTGGTVASGILSDVTEARETEAALVRTRQDADSAKRVKSSFISMMSHEIRTPLGSIRGFAELLLEEIAGLDAPPVVTEFATTIHEGAGKVLRLVNEIFDLATLQSGRVLVEHNPTPLHPVIEALAQTQQAAFAARGLALVLDLADGEPIVLGEAGRIGQVLEQLLSNALKFTDAGEVRMATQIEAGGVCIRVEDTGIGVAPAYVGEMFEPFSQGDNRLNRDYEGSGLGLALAKRLVEAMNGTISATSTPGEGTAFEITLPRADA